MYRDLELYRTSEGRKRAEINQMRDEGLAIRRSDKSHAPFQAGEAVTTRSTPEPDVYG